MQKAYRPKVSKSKNVGTRESLATPKPRKPRFLLRWSPTGKMFDSAGKIVAPSGDNACTSNTMEPKIKRFPNSTPLLGRLSRFVCGASTQNKLMEQKTSMCEMVGQLIQKKQEEKQIQEDQAANTRYWKILAYYDDDDDYNFPITPNETIDYLIMGDKHLDTIPATKSDEFIKSSVENLVP
nr:hypothetical protein [Tanacetum cinerariifolium]